MVQLSVEEGKLSVSVLHVIGCTPLIHCPILYSAKEHIQNRSFGLIKLPGVLNSSISWKIRTFSIPQAVFFVGKCSSIFR